MQDPKITSNRPFPPVCLLEKLENERPTVSQEEIEKVKTRIVEILEHFEIPFIDIEVQCGLSYTSYKIRVAPGTRVTKIMNLEEEFCCLLQDFGRARLNVPLPYKIAFSLEITNASPQTVSLRTLIESDAFQKTEAELPVALGVTINNEPVVMDLAKLPHLLIGGATGQGKSVCLHTIITSLLCHHNPQNLQFVLVDSKKVELSAFESLQGTFLAKIPNMKEGILHSTEDTVEALQALCAEMDARYELLRASCSRNIIDYNAKLRTGELKTDKGNRLLPYLVMVIDEFADFMLTAKRKFEQPLVRLAQLSRVVGIHLVITTQRPSYKFITGGISANFPSCIAFRTSTSIDSRTILFKAGAENLNGNGDMLLLTGSGILRVQGAYVSERESRAVVDWAVENHEARED